MKVSIKDLAVNMEVKTRGVEFEVRDNQNKFIGDVFVTSTGLIWCAGKTTRQNGKKISWKNFIELVSE